MGVNVVGKLLVGSVGAPYWDVGLAEFEEKEEVGREVAVATKGAVETMLTEYVGWEVDRTVELPGRFSGGAATGLLLG